MKFEMACSSQDILAQSLENVICLHCAHTLTPLRELSVAKKMVVMKRVLFLHRLLTFSMNSTALSCHLVTRQLDNE